MLLDELCNIKLSESKATKGAFTYYVITVRTRGGGVSTMFMHDYGGGVVL